MTDTSAMIRPRRSDDRGETRTSWLEGRHSFSFGSYFDPAHPGFRALRVLNEDVIAPLSGFGAHPHRDMEILTWLLDGQLEHRDSGGAHGILTPGTAQLMSAGRGIVHSEMNPSPDRATHLLQIWLHPDRDGRAPGYAERAIDSAAGIPIPIATPDGRDGSLRIHQDAAVSVLRLGDGDAHTWKLEPERHAWLQLARGDVALGDAVLHAGDGAAVSGERALSLRSDGDCELILFDLA